MFNSMKRDKVKFFAFFLASKYKYKYTLEFPASSGMMTLYARAKKRPSLQMEVDEFIHQNRMPAIRPGSHRWEPISLRVIDTWGKFSEEQIFEFRNWVLNPPADNQGYAISAARKEIRLCVVDPTGMMVEQFVLFGSYVSGYTIDDNFMANDNVIDCDITVNMDHCLLTF